jgi:plastocyanin
MRRWIAVGSLVGGLVALLWIPSAALAGAGCHGEPTLQHDATGSEGATVSMVDACFDATITSVDPGARITFVNEDSATHNVGGMGWGHYEDMSEGDTYTARFDDAGIYPFACSYHLGMTGAIVVGDGTGAGNGLSVSGTPPMLDPLDAVPSAAAAPRSDVAWVAAAAAGGIAVGATAAFVLGRRFRRPAAS